MKINIYVMKYLRLFDSNQKGWENYKFKYNEFVMRIDDKTIYQVQNASPGWNNIRKYEVRRVLKIKNGEVETSGGSSEWILESELIKVEPKDLELLFYTNKYNL